MTTPAGEQLPRHCHHLEVEVEVRRVRRQRIRVRRPQFKHRGRELGRRRAGGWEVMKIVRCLDCGATHRTKKTGDHEWLANTPQWAMEVGEAHQ